MTTKMQKTILDIANNAKINNIDQISAVQEYFIEKESRLTRSRVDEILSAAREAEHNEKKENNMQFTLGIKGSTGGGRNGIDDEYFGRIVVIVSKNEITMTTKCVEALGNPVFAELHFNETHFALKSSANSRTGYKLQTRDKGNVSKKNRYLASSKQIRDEQLAIGFYYAGTLQEDGMVVFSRTPTGQWR